MALLELVAQMSLCHPFKLQSAPQMSCKLIHYCSFLCTANIILLTVTSSVNEQNNLDTAVH